MNIRQKIIDDLLFKYRYRKDTIEQDIKDTEDTDLIKQLNTSLTHVDNEITRLEKMKENHVES